MLIKDFRDPENYLGNIVPGTVFVINNAFYMAIEPIEEKEVGAYLNAVNLDTGELAHYFDTDSIQLVEAELCVRDKN